MTGFGEASRQHDGLAVAVEVRTINSRYFKLSVRCSEGYSALEPDIENFVRQRVKRGTVQVAVRVGRVSAGDEYRINVDVLDGYRRQLEALQTQWHLTEAVSLEKLLQLPGVIHDEPLVHSAAAQAWPALAAVLQEALDNLAQMRAEEGRAMQADLAHNARAALAELEGVARRAPLVAEAYRTRLEDRIGKLLAEHGLTLDPADLIREVGLFAERCDISEEIVRLRSHLEQFQAVLELPESAGRKLEFLAQEMLREANTIGSKASDVEVSRHVIEIKTAIERIKEMIQNVE